MGGDGPRRGCVRPRALAPLRPVRRVDLGRLQLQGVLRRFRRQCLDRHQPRPFAIPAGRRRLSPSVPPPVVFTSVKLGDKTVDPSHSLEMPYQENSLQVRFAALTFVQESSVLFRYRLAGESHGLARNHAARAELSQAASGPVHAGGDGAQRAGIVERGAGPRRVPGADAMVADVLVPHGMRWC